MTEAEFEDLLQRYLDGTSQPGERELIEQWSNQLGEPENFVLPPTEREQVRAAMWRQIEHLTQGRSGNGPTDHTLTGKELHHSTSFWRMPVVRWLAAALLILGVALAVVLPQTWKSTLAPSTMAVEWTQHHNKGKKTELLTLSDGSRVTLFPGSSLHYRPGLIGSRREVRLQGEAFFQVAKNPDRPFLVYTDQLVTTVLGTSFRVKAYAGRKNEVAVQEGRVSVQLRRGADLSATPVQPATEGVILLPNQQVMYSALTPRPLRKQLVQNPVVLVPQTFTFDKQPVSKVLQALEKAYGVELVYDEAKVANCTITITFYQESESLYDRLDVLSKALGASYSLADNARILFHSDGCTP
ncbi:FecR domain-containing protein [Hymenobacter sp. BT507]|uniref:FecR domain-containing protein n=1 Tax=Hymenobacter citatus TaxID=2763506 RepID=A0ABR7MLJ4_9BACT|nr:FecR family protein [Hymenobacter citatus]MBC6611951.1 FecR domain-containing protein [Hymenobacter citatus]